MLIDNTPKPKRKNDVYYDEPVRPSFLQLFLSGLWRYFVVLPVVGMWQATKWSVKQTWAVTRWGFSTAWSITKWAATSPFLAIAWVWNWLFGFGNLPTFENIYQREAYLKIKRKFRRSKRFYTHSTLFFAINALIWLNVLGTSASYSSSNSFSGALSFTVAWGFILGTHFLRNRMADTEETELERVLYNTRGLSRGRVGDEKRKNVLYEETEDWQQYEEYDTSHLEENLMHDEDAQMDESPLQRRRR